MSKLIKLAKNPSLFIRDFFLKRNPLILNEIKCPIDEEQTLIRHEEFINQALENKLEIDVVYTWVDDTDSKWKNSFKKTKAATCEEKFGLHALDSARFANNDELRYSVESVKKNMPWVRHIYVVTDMQRPTWVTSDSDIKIIDHKDIISSKYLPTFNSHVIEACLHNIPGLSENFIYFNDDVFVARPLHKSHFFLPNGVASIFVSLKSIRQMKNQGVCTPTLGAMLHSRKLLKKNMT